MPSRLMTRALTQIADNVLYCIDALLVNRSLHSPDYNHQISVRETGNGYCLGILTRKEDWSSKTYVWYFPISYAFLAARNSTTTLFGFWSTFDLSDCDSFTFDHFSRAFVSNDDVDGFELDAGEDAEDLNSVEFRRVNSQWFIKSETIFGVQCGSTPKLCALCKHRLDCLCYSPCGAGPSEEGMRRRGVRLEKSGIQREVVSNNLTKAENRKNKQRKHKQDKILEQEKQDFAVDALVSPLRRKKRCVDERSLSDSLERVSLLEDALTDRRITSFCGDKSKVPPLIFCKVAGSHVPLRSVSRELAPLMEEFSPQVSLGSLFNLHVHHEISEELGDALEGFHKTFTNVTEKIPTGEDVKNTFKEIGGSLKDLFQNTLLYGIPIAAVSYCVYRLIYALKNRRRDGWKSVAFWAFVSNFFIGLFLNLVVEVLLMPTTFLVNNCRELMAFIKVIQNRQPAPEVFMDPLDAEEEFSAQSLNEVDGKLMSGVATMVLSFFSLQAVGSAPDNRKVEKFLTLVGQLPRATTGVEFVMDNVIEMIQLAVNFVRSKILGLDTFTWFEESFPEVDRWCRKVQKVADESREVTWLINSVNSQRVFELYKEGNSLFLNKYKNLDSARVRNAIQAYMTVLKKIMVPFEQANISGVAPRMEPVTLFLGGAPGVGKSLITIPLLTEVILEILPEERRPELLANYMDFIYNRQTEHQYWDRYYGQIACVFDDFLQKRDVAGQPDCETMDIIRVTNMFPNVLHMAALENKGNTVFTSRLVVCTSNTFNVKVESIVEPRALTRRFNHTYRVVPAAQFCTPETRDGLTEHRILDKEHTQIKGSALNYDAIEFEEMKWGDGHEAFPTGRVITFKQLVQIMVNDYRSRSDRSDAYNAIVKDSLQKKFEAMTKQDCPVEEFVPHVGESSSDDTSDSEMEVDVSLLNNFFKGFDYEEELPEINLKTLELSDIDEDFPDIDKGEIPRKLPLTYDAVEPLFQAGFSVVQVSNLAFRISPPCVVRHGVSKTIWAFAMTVPLFWERMVERAFVYRGLCEIDQGVERLEAVVDRLMLKPGVRQKIEKTMGQKLQFGVHFVNDNDMTLLEQSRQSLQDFYQHVVGKVKNFVKEHPYMTIFGLVGMAFAAWKGFSMLRSFLGGEGDPMTAESGHARKGKDKAYRQKSTRVPALMDFSSQSGVDRKEMEEAAYAVWQSQGGGDLCAIQMIKRIVQKSSYGIHVPWSDRLIGSVLFVKGRVCIFPNHYVSYFKNKVKEGECDMDTEICLKNSWLTEGYRLTVADFIDVRVCPHLTQQDVAILVCPDRVHQHADITNYFVSVKTLDKPLDLTVHLVVLGEERSWQIHSGIAKAVNDHPVGDGKERWRVTTGFLYPFPTSRGDCGSALLLNNKAINPGKILGIHVAGNNSNYGLAATITKDMIESALSLIDISAKISAPDDVLLGPQLMDKPYDANVVPLFRTDKKPSMAGNSKIIPSVLFGAWGYPKTKPAYLRPIVREGELLDPRKIGLAGYCEGNVPINAHFVDVIVDNIASNLVGVARRKQRRKPMIFSYEEAVKGIVGLDYCDPIDRTTSPGYPWVLEKPSGFAGKTWWFGTEGDLDTDNPRSDVVKKKVMEIIDAAKKGKRLFHAYMDFPKDERRKIAKVESLATRSISGCPLDLSLVTRMFFLDFAIFMMECRFETKTCVGISPRSDEWNVLAKLLQRFSNIVAGDFSGFDKRQIAEFLWGCLRIINIWYNDGRENALIREVLWADVVNSIHLFDGNFVQWIKSLPSGHPLTVIINSLVHEMYLQYCYILANPEGLFGLQTYYDLVEAQTYGDDGVYSISDVAIGWFNQRTITQAMAAIGLVFTDEHKSQNPLPFRKLEEVSFLKRGFRRSYIDGKFVGPLEMATIIEMPFWTKEGPAPDEITKDNVCTALMELSLHDEDDYDRASEMIIQACRDRMNWLPPVVDYNANYLLACGTREEW
jgi:hypothetical protein